METIAPFVPLIVIIAVITAFTILIVRWRKSVNYLKHGGIENLKAHGIVPVKAKQLIGTATDSGASGGWVPMSVYKEKVVGITKRNSDGTYRQIIASKLQEGDPLHLARNPQNPYDKNAIEVFTAKYEQIGFIAAERAEELAPQMDKGYRVEAKVERVMGGESEANYGVLVSIQRYKPAKTP